MLRGRAWVFGDHVNTDAIAPRGSATPEGWQTQLCMSPLRPGWAGQVRAGDILVTGHNFGCGSSRESAAWLIKELGIACIVGASFARTFFRNAINIGLPVLRCPEATARTTERDLLEVDLETGRIRNLTRHMHFAAEPLPAFVRDIVGAGGLLPWARRQYGSPDPHGPSGAAGR